MQLEEDTEERPLYKLRGKSSQAQQIDDTLNRLKRRAENWPG
jgi:hypothetical protein